jgi:phosphoadenosine phosphosulfate reductase
MNDLPTSDELALWSRAFEHSDPRDVIGWSLAVYGRRLTLGTGFGASGMVLLDMVLRARRDVDLFFLDTGLLFPETYALREHIEARYGVRLRAVRGLTLAEQQAAYGDRLWERSPDQCCDLRKVRPLGQALAGYDAWMTALRRDQAGTRRDTPLLVWDERRGVAKISPLARWSERDCWAYIRHHNLPHNPLHGRGYPSIGCWPCTTTVQPGDDLRAGRWAAHAGKTECGLHRENGRAVRA